MDSQAQSQAQRAISDEIVKIHEDSYGAGVAAIKTYILDDAVLIIIDVELTEAERTLLEAGKDDAVRRTREDFQAVVGATFIAVVERATGRRVTSWVSRMQVEGDPFSVEVFRLAEAP